jgi:hypothetical protein
MAKAEDWPDIAHMSREELEAEVAALRHALNMLRDEATPDTLMDQTEPYRIGWRSTRRPWLHRPWQAESDLCRFARRGFTARAAQRKLRGDENHVQRYGQPSLYQLYRSVRARRWERRRTVRR